jgi:uncharacterized protein YoxC
MSELGNLGEYGVGVLAIIVLFMIIKMMMNFAGHQTKALDRNTKAYEGLTKVLQMQYEANTVFQTRILSLSEDTNKKVGEIHRKVV